MKPKRKRSFISTCLCVATLCFATQCDDTMSLLDEDNGSFSIFATVDMDDDVHFFRVNDLNTTLHQEKTAVIDARISLENKTTGITSLLADSMVNFQGVYTHNFFTDEMEYGHTYKLTAERISDGRSVSGQWTTPRRAKIEVDGLPAERGGGGCASPITIKYTPVSNLSDMDLRISAGGIKYFKPIFVKGEDESVSATFSLFDVSRAAFGNSVDDCTNLESGRLLSFNLIHYGPDYFENNFTGDIEDLITIGAFGALYEEDTLYQPFKE